MQIQRVDSHQHFWQLDKGYYEWLTQDLESIYRDFLPEDLTPLLAESGIEKTILVQAAACEAETHFMLSLAERLECVAGVVGWVDMASKNAGARIQALAANPCFKGIRPMIQDIADPDWMLKPELDAAFNTLIEHDLSFDALVLPQHLPNLLTLLQRYPSLRCVIDHGAKPHIAKGTLQPWCDHMAVIASETESFCKISGLVTEAGDHPNKNSLQPYFDHLYQCFGAQRLMWGSDWPVVNLSMSYLQWRELSLTLMSALNEYEQEQLLGATAASFYRL